MIIWNVSGQIVRVTQSTVIVSFKADDFPAQEGDPVFLTNAIFPQAAIAAAANPQLTEKSRTIFLD